MTIAERGGTHPQYLDDDETHRVDQPDTWPANQIEQFHSWLGRWGKDKHADDVLQSLYKLCNNNLTQLNRLIHELSTGWKDLR